MSTTSNVWARLRSKRYRDHFVAAQVKQAIPYQIRALMKDHGISQAKLAERAGLTQGAISRAANPKYGNLSLNTLVRIAAGFDVAFIGQFVPFSELDRWLTHLHDERASISTFEEEDARHQASTTIGADVTEQCKAVISSLEESMANQKIPEPFATSEQPRGDDEKWRYASDAVPRLPTSGVHYPSGGPAFRVLAGPAERFQFAISSPQVLDHQGCSRPRLFPAFDAGWQAEMLKAELPERSQEGQKELAYV